jgi:hypothetical protein
MSELLTISKITLKYEWKYEETWQRSIPSQTRGPETCLSQESNLDLCGGRRACTLEKSHLISLLIAIRNIYSKWAGDQGNCSRQGSPQFMCYMNIHEHTWTALGCRLNSTCKTSASHLPAAKTSGTCKSPIRYIYIWAHDQGECSRLNIPKTFLSAVKQQATALELLVRGSQISFLFIHKYNSNFLILKNFKTIRVFNRGL